MTPTPEEADQWMTRTPEGGGWLMNPTGEVGDWRMTPIQEGEPKILSTAEGARNRTHAAAPTTPREQAITTRTALTATLGELTARRPTAAAVAVAVLEADPLTAETLGTASTGLEGFRRQPAADGT